MHARTRITAIVLSAPVALAVVAGPLAGAAVADPPRIVRNTITVEPLSYQPVSEHTHGNITVTVFTERSTDEGDLDGTARTTWTCAKREGTSVSRCTGESTTMGTGALRGPGEVRLRATCTESGVFPRLLVACEGRYTYEGRGALEGLHGQGTFTSSGFFVFSITGTSEMRLHDHR